MLSENKAVFDRLGITRWHDLGYTGKRGLSITHEFPQITPNMRGLVTYPFPEVSPSQDSHAYWTTMVHLEVAPDRRIACVPFWPMIKDGTVTGMLVDKVIPYMVENKVDTGYASIKYSVSGFDKVYETVLDFCTLCNASGNEGEIEYSALIRDNAWLGVGAVAYKQGQFVPESYSSESPHVDFCGIAPFYVPTTIGTSHLFDGTSCAAPFLSGMIALVNDFFIDKIGRPLSHSEMYEFMKAHCKDLYIDGKDNKTGLGIPILPDPATINPFEWVEDMSGTNYGNYSAWAETAVKYCVDKGYFKGDGNGNFRWQDTITREELAQLLYNIKA